MEYERTKMGKVKMFLSECRRVLRVTRRPDSTEFKIIVKASGLGMIVIGLIGFLITMAKLIFVQ
ncbi:protein translocase SEC61 complex subunit gamma [Candidatus Woesearchaeota archaeon]|nr:protein translocase SEC61 complex subunit gamma [Candidatus Woesearchaeota archaeon]